MLQVPLDFASATSVVGAWDLMFGFELRVPSTVVAFTSRVIFFCAYEVVEKAISIQADAKIPRMTFFIFVVLKYW